MAKVIYCSKVSPISGCEHVIRGETVEDVLEQAGKHAVEHGLEPSPELIERVKEAIEDE